MKDYLRSHKSFLEDYLLSEVPVVALQKILKRKTCRRDSGKYTANNDRNLIFFLLGFEVASTIGDAITKLQVRSLATSSRLQSYYVLSEPQDTHYDGDCQQQCSKRPPGQICSIKSVQVHC